LVAAWFEQTPGHTAAHVADANKTEACILFGKRVHFSSPSISILRKARIRNLPITIALNLFSLGLMNNWAIAVGCRAWFEPSSKNTGGYEYQRTTQNEGQG
jgi:hypothetical protein